MRRLLLPVLLAALTVPLGVTSPATAADPDVPRVQTVTDPRGDVRGSAPAAVKRSIDVSSLRVSREAVSLQLRFRLRDVRSFGSWRQGATIALVRPVLTQRFTVVGGRVLRGDPADGRVCEDARVSRRVRADVLVVDLPFSCIRTTPGRALELRAAGVALRAGGVDPRATDRVRSVRADPR